MSFITKVYDPTRREVHRHHREVAAINAMEQELTQLDDAGLRARTDRFRERLEAGEELLALRGEAFAVAREGARRHLGMRPFDVQLIGAAILDEGKIAEMKTGEGKTLVASLALYLNALTGRGVHLVTVNDFLARRDAGWNAPYLHALGLSVGVIIPEQSLCFDPDFRDESHHDERLRHLRPVSRQEAYAADIVYATNNEMGFDYLRDNLARAIDQRVQRDRYFAIVDEVDSILIDEARTPLIISGAAQESTEKYYQFADVVRRLRAEDDYTIDEKSKSASLTDPGTEKVQRATGIANIFDIEHVDEAHQLNQALRAHAIYRRDVDYIVKDGEIVIVDEFTGRTMPGRRWSDGLHQAIEAKERLRVQQEQRTLATVTFQNYFRTFEKLAGMTGTAATEAEEFHKIYGLEVVPVPTHRPMVRLDQADLVFRGEEAKFRAIADDIEERHQRGQPVLVGTVSIEKSERLARILEKRGVDHEVLNAKLHEREAEVIASAGAPAAVTIATNMAGRGTDIVLGAGVAEAGGLYVIGTERHESRRIDNQLRGRSGRQGDPGESRFYLSFEDDLMRVFGGERMQGWMQRLGVDDETPLESRMVSRQIESAQSRVEGFNFDNRRYVVEYDDVVNRQREVIYEERDRILEGVDTRTNLFEWMEEVIRDTVGLYCHGRHKAEWELEPMWQRLRELVPFPAAETVDLEALGDTPEEVRETLVKEAHRLYEEKEARYPEEVVRSAETQLMLEILDTKWADYLTLMEHLKDDIRWQSLGQRDPLVVFKEQAFATFQELQEEIKQEVVRYLSHMEIELGGPPPELEAPVGLPVHPEAPTAAAAAAGIAGLAGAAMDPAPELTLARMTGQGSLSPAQGPGPVAGRRLGGPVGTVPAVGRNAFCPCGSGRKYKRCHGAAAAS
ncbi:MAG TPA: preprotein translocase subunit SecA [Candidatus Micrarchaeia archaeon]|nr:preprotein translocase subunit SecA [Candidatus Micrarchaeia archaeon]